MSASRSLNFILAATLVLGTSTAVSATNAGTEQLRNSVTPALRSAGLSESCIQDLTSSELTAIFNMVHNDSDGQLSTVRQRERIRSSAADVCTSL